MRRRDFISLAGGSAVAWPLAVRAQQLNKLPTIGYLGAAAPAGDSQRIAAFVKRLRELGWSEGNTVTITFRWADGSSAKMAEIAAELVRLKVDVIVATGTGGVLAARHATSIIPIVFTAASDPVGAGLVASLARPGGTITGLSLQQTDSASKRLELLREVVPGLRRLGIIGNLDNPAIVLELGEVQAAARALGLEVATPEIRRVEDFVPAFDALKGRVDAIYLATDALVIANRISDQHPGAHLAAPDHLQFERVRRPGRPDILWAKLPRPLPAHRRGKRRLA